MLDFKAAQTRLIARAQRTNDRERCPLAELAGRIAANDVAATLDLPPADSSLVSGYAVRAADAGHPGAVLRVQQRCFLGQVPAPQHPGEASRVFVGSLIPRGADAVVPQDDCDEVDGHVTLHAAARRGRNLSLQGSALREGHVLLTRGVRLDVRHVAVLAAQGLEQIPVYPRLRVGLLTLGAEQSAPGTTLEPGARYDAATALLSSLCQALGAEVSTALRAADEPDAVHSALRTLHAGSDLILVAASPFEPDAQALVTALEALNAPAERWPVAMRPAPHLISAQLDRCPVVCLPGAPDALLATFVLLVSPLVRAMQGCDAPCPPVQQGLLGGEPLRGGEYDRFCYARAQSGAHDLPEIIVLSSDGHDALAALPRADGLVRIPAHLRLSAGMALDWYSLADWTR